jgi:hypothetical protein
MATIKELLYGDVGYEGTDANPSMFSVDYYRNKVREFQDSLNRLAATRDALASVPFWAVDESSYAAITDWLNDYEIRRAWIMEAAEGVNLLAQGANAVGIRFPVVSIPSGLNAVPPLLAVAGIAALTAIVAVVEWAATMQMRAKTVAEQTRIIAELPEDQRAAALQSLANVQTISEQSSISATIANSIKWIVIGVGAIFALKLLADR